MINTDMKLKPTAFAFIDILGYGNIMSRNPIDVLFLVKEMLETSIRNQFIQRDIDRFTHFSSNKQVPIIEYLQFSDTILIWLQAEDHGPELFKTPNQMVETICYATSIILAQFISAGVPLRGAVGFGPTFISIDPLFFVGRELYLTAQLEKRQAWAGAILHESAEKKLSQESKLPFVTEYRVPMRQSFCFRSLLNAIDWVTPLRGNPLLTPPWEIMFQSKRIKVKKMGKETRKFYKFINQQQNRSFPAYLSEGTIGRMRERLKWVT